MRFGSAVRVSGRAVAVAAALEDALRTRGDRDLVNRKDAAFERRIFFLRGERLDFLR